MTFLRVLMAALVLASASLTLDTPASAQFFPFFDRPPPAYRPGRRLPGTGDVPPPSEREYVNPRRQYVPEQQAARPRRPNFLERLFGRPFERDRREDRAPGRAAPPPGGGGGGGGGQSGGSETAAPAKRAVPKTVFVAVIGDSLAENLAPGLTDALSERPEVGLVREVRPGTGFLEEPEKPWRQIADEILARNPPVAAAVVFMGPNDDPPAPPPKKAKQDAASEEAQPVLTASPWMDQYAAKVDDIAFAFRQKNIPLIWVGLPPVEDAKVMADHLFLNDLVRQRVAALGGTFVDVWEGFVNEEDEFTVQGANIEGRDVRLRMADGVHFTRAGARKLGHYVELELRPYLAPKDQSDAVADVGVDPGAPTTPGSSRILLLGQAPRAPGGVLVTAAAPQEAKPQELKAEAEKPDAANVDGAKANEATPGTPPAGEAQAGFDSGIIAPEGTAPDQPSADETASKAEPQTPPVPESVLITGAAVPPKPGRGDDFAWPQSAVAN